MSDKKLKIQTVADPLAGLPITMDIEQDSLAEQKAMTDAFIEQAVKAAKVGSFKAKGAKENERRRLATNPNFWCCLVFQSEAQKVAFLQNAGLVELGERYLDGRLVAKILGVSIPEQTVKFQGEKEDAAMTLGFEPIEPFPATLTAKKKTAKPSRRKRASSPLKNVCKHIQLQQFAPTSQSWYWAGEMQLLPNGVLRWADTAPGDMVLKQDVFDIEKQELCGMDAGVEPWFAAWIKYGGYYDFNVVPMDDPARAAEVLPTPDDVAYLTQSPQDIDRRFVVDDRPEEPDATTQKPNEEQQIDWDSGHLIEPDVCFLEIAPDGTITDINGFPLPEVLRKNPPQPSEDTSPNMPPAK